MNIFAVDQSPVISAQSLPDRHVVKMCIENAQMLAVALGDKRGLGWGTIRKKDGTPYGQGAHYNHPCTIWVRAEINNLAWTIVHGLSLCAEYTNRYGKVHSSIIAHLDAKELFHSHTDLDLSIYHKVRSFARAMPEEYKFDTSISDTDAYKMYVASKPWVCDNYLRVPSRKPEWVG